VKKHLSLFVTAAAGALALAYVFFVFLPGQTRIADLRKTLQQKQQYVAQSTKLIAVLNDLQSELDECHSFIETWRANAPTGSKLADLIGSLTNNAEEAHVQFVAFHPSPTHQLGLLRETPATIKVKGPFHAVADFLRRLESVPAAIWIPTVNLKPEGESGQDISCELTLSIFSDASDIAD